MKRRQRADSLLAAKRQRRESRLPWAGKRLAPDGPTERAETREKRPCMAAPPLAEPLVTLRRSELEALLQERYAAGSAEAELRWRGELAALEAHYQRLYEEALPVMTGPPQRYIY